MNSIRRILLFLAVLSTAGSALAAPPWSSGPYRYDGNGNVVAIGDERYVYDGVSRLTNATVRTGYQQDYTYDSFGNRKSASGTTTDCVSGTAAIVCGQDTQITFASETNRLQTYATYDPAGNVRTFGGTHAYDYDPTGMIAVQTDPGGARKYLYTAGDERIAVVNGSAWNWTLRDTDNTVLREVNSNGPAGTLTWSEDYVYQSRSLLGSDTLAGQRHYHSDHLGTPRVLSDENGRRIGEHAYLPFGVELAVASREQPEERLKFTGHERDVLNDAHSLDYMHARYGASMLGRFLSVDPVMSSADPRFPQSWNRYTYALNNPLNYIDPTGENATVVCDADNNCTATVEAQIVADPHNQAQMTAARDFSNGAINYWQGRQEKGRNGENITFQVNITIVAPGQTVAGVDTLSVVSGAGRSNVQMTLLTGGRNAESAPDTGTIFTTDSTNNPSGMAGVSAHETGHLFGLKDIYPPAGVAAWNANGTESIMMYAQPTNAVLTGWWVLHPANGNSVVHRQQGPPRRCMTGPC